MLRFLCVTMIFSALVGCATSTPTAPLVRDVSVSTLLREVNSIRGRHGLVPVERNRRLDTAAEEQAMFQASTETMSHAGFRGAELGDRLFRARYRYRVAGENVSRGYVKERSVVRAWMQSPSHRKMLLHPELFEAGASAAMDEDGTVYWTLVMAAPQG